MTDTREVFQLVMDKPCENCGRNGSWTYKHEDNLYKTICFCGCVRLFDPEAVEKYADYQKGAFKNWADAREAVAKRQQTTTT